MVQVGLAWVGLDWAGWSWIGRDWIRLDWIELGQVGWIGLGLVGLGGTGLGWVGLDWVGLDWIRWAVDISVGMDLHTHTYDMQCSNGGLLVDGVRGPRPVLEGEARLHGGKDG